MPRNLNIVICGLSLSSSWGNGHATTYRHLMRGLRERGHRVLFLERDISWYADHRDLTQTNDGELALYESLEQLKDCHANTIRHADMVVVGSYVPDGIALGRWVVATARGVTAFYDIDTPVTLNDLDRRQCAYLDRELIPRYDLYLSFSGGPVLRQLEHQYGAACARPLYCSVDPEVYFPEAVEQRFDLGYMGTYSDDRQASLMQLLVDPARYRPTRRFIVAGPQYPASIAWPENVVRREHLPPDEHRAFYGQQRFTLNLTREAMRRLGYSPSIRLFEAAACGTAIISDPWPGLNNFFEIDSEILVARSSRESLEHLQYCSESDRKAVGERARQRVLAKHTGHHRARELEQYIEQIRARYVHAGGAHLESARTDPEWTSGNVFPMR